MDNGDIKEINITPNSGGGVYKITGKLKKTFNNMNLKKDNTTEIKEKVFKTLKENKRHLQIRILKSFPNLNLRNKK